MKSRASIKSHPIHPILVGFPIAFFTGALVFDVLAYLYGEGFSNTALYLVIAGLISALAAAVPGVIDYISTVPPVSSAQ